MSDPATVLHDALLTELQREKVVLLHTIDAESGLPTSNAISWAHAMDARTIRFALDQRSRLVGNLQQNAVATMTGFAEGSVHIISGKVNQVAESLEDVPFKLACFDLSVETVRDGMFYGARISAEPEYEKTYDQRAAEKLDHQVFTAMKKA
ncbi:pyridoxamine 5'-phosphate oxidase family protein [Marinicrinis sediminis]|uniref:Pyridoxamine 5'-phosphate oxidase family protein n=1 Tax=Marinicrinis sediminis TaxID=1652465 RepID=A0ABW5RCJ2_9BACL